MRKNNCQVYIDNNKNNILTFYKQLIKLAVGLKSNIKLSHLLYDYHCFVFNKKTL